MIDPQASAVSLGPRWVLAGYWGLILVGTHLPGKSMPAGAFTIDKPIHLIAFAVLGCLMAVCVTPRRGRLAIPTAATLVLAAICYGGVDELTQPLFGRSCDFYDWVADACGATLGVGAYAVWTRIRGNAERRTKNDEARIPVSE